MGLDVNREPRKAATRRGADKPNFRRERCLGQKSMNSESTLVQRSRRAVPGNYPHLTLVEPPRGQTKIVLRVEGLRKHYGAIEAVAGVSFDLRRGEIFGLLGITGRAKPH